MNKRKAAKKEENKIIKKENSIKFYSIIITIIAIVLLLIILISGASIGVNEAKRKALNYGNFKEDDIIYINIDRDYEDKVYEIKFKDDSYIYEIDVHMKTGEIINFEKDAINQSSVSIPDASNLIDEEEAKKIALNHTNQKEENVTFTKVKTDIESGHEVYEIEFSSTDAFYEVVIDINTKEVIKYDIDYKEQQISEDKYIGVDKAKEIALKHAGLKESQIKWHKAKLDVEYNYSVYEIEFSYQYKEYEYEINAASGDIIKYEIDRF